MIQVGKRCYFESAPWILNQVGATTPQIIDVSPWVPEDAVAYGIQVVLFRASMPPGNPSGYIDSAAIIRLPGHTDVNYSVAALLVGMLQPGGQLEGGGFGHIIVPNINRQFYWLIQGSTLQYGANLSLALPWYELP